MSPTTSAWMGRVRSRARQRVLRKPSEVVTCVDLRVLAMGVIGHGCGSLETELDEGDNWCCVNEFLAPVLGGGFSGVVLGGLLSSAVEAIVVVKAVAAVAKSLSLLQFKEYAAV
ncbi:hypothetical protein Droror1_Dr00026728, partial [Drosera rotundifolia]